MAKRGRRPKKREHQLGDFWLSKRSGNSCWYLFWHQDGRIARLSTGTTNFADAEQFQAEHFLSKQRLRQEQPEAVTLIAVLKHYDDGHGQYKRSAAEIKRVSNMMGEFWPVESVAEITIEEQKRFVAHLRGRGHSDGYVKRILGVLGAALRWAYNEKQLATVPAVLSSKHFGPDVERSRILSVDELARLWGTEMPPHLRTFVVLALCTASRPEALLELRRDQLNLERRLIHLNPEGRKQTKKHRPTLPICDTLLPWLSLDRDYQIEWRENQDQPIRSIKTSWRKLRKDAGLGVEVVPYTPRHTVATELRTRGVPEWECRGFMGHKTAGTTERYAKYRADHMSASSKAIDGFCAEIHAKTTTRLILGSVIPRQFCARRFGGDA